MLQESPQKKGRRKRIVHLREGRKRAIHEGFPITNQKSAALATTRCTPMGTQGRGDLPYGERRKGHTTVLGKVEKTTSKAARGKDQDEASSR